MPRLELRVLEAGSKVKGSGPIREGISVIVSCENTDQGYLYSVHLWPGAEFGQRADLPFEPYQAGIQSVLEEPNNSTIVRSLCVSGAFPRTHGPHGKKYIHTEEYMASQDLATVLQDMIRISGVLQPRDNFKVTVARPEFFPWLELTRNDSTAAKAKKEPETVLRSPNHELKSDIIIGKMIEKLHSNGEGRVGARWKLSQGSMPLAVVCRLDGVEIESMRTPPRLRDPDHNNSVPANGGSLDNSTIHQTPNAYVSMNDLASAGLSPEFSIYLPQGPNAPMSTGTQYHTNPLYPVGPSGMPPYQKNSAVNNESLSNLLPGDQAYRDVSHDAGPSLQGDGATITPHDHFGPVHRSNPLQQYSSWRPAMSLPVSQDFRFSDHTFEPKTPAHPSHPPSLRYDRPHYVPPQQQICPDATDYRSMYNHGYPTHVTSNAAFSQFGDSYHYPNQTPRFGSTLLHAFPTRVSHNAGTAEEDRSALLTRESGAPAYDSQGHLIRGNRRQRRE